MHCGVGDLLKYRDWKIVFKSISRHLKHPGELGNQVQILNFRFKESEYAKSKCLEYLIQKTTVSQLLSKG